MKSLKILVLSAIFLNVPWVHAGYTQKVPGFFLNHFAQMKDLKDPLCNQFMNKLYRGGQPTFDGSNQWLQKIQEKQIKMVFDLREEKGNAAKERDTLLKNGIAYVNLPLRTSGSSQLEQMTVEVALPPTEEGAAPSISKKTMKNVDATLYVLSLMEGAIMEPSNKGIYLHCMRGEDRTGLMIALLRNCQQNSQDKKANTSWKSEFSEYGGSMYKPLQKLMTDVNKSR
jgi:hypothetical protein